ncbi:MAG: tetratricopeptide repeat protein [Chloroflexi bacterium]|nr:tetratricopeptide repeat protein [Chloroflexota bacterium]
MPANPPDPKDNLPELLKNLWLPFAGFLGAVTLAYNFYKLWLGDQTTVTFFLAGAGLMLLIIAFTWVGFKVNTVTRDAVWPIGAKVTDQNPAFSPLWRRVARIGLGIVLLGGIVGGVSYYKHRQEAQDKLIVLITTFEGPEDVYGLRNQMIESLNVEFSNNSAIQILIIPDVITPDQGSPAARDLGKRYQADIVIWGWYRPTDNPKVTIHIENLSPQLSSDIDESFTFNPVAKLEDLESFEFQQHLGGETAALINFLAGLIKFQAEDQSAAILLFDKSLAVLEAADSNMVNDLAPLYFYRGNAHLGLNQFDLALADLSRAIQLDPQFSSAYTNRGLAHSFLLHYDLALDDYSKAIQLDPQNASAYNNRGSAYNSLEKYGLAIADLTKSIQIEPQDALHYNNRGGTYINMRQYDQAIADFTRAIQLDPKFALAYNNRGLGYSDTGQLELALADFTRVIQLDPKYARAYSNRGDIYARQGKYDQAIDEFTQAVQIDPLFVKAYNNRGSVYDKLGQFNAAIIDYSTAIQLDPQYAISYNNRGVDYDHLNLPDKAIADYDMAIKLDPQFGTAYFNRGVTYFNLKQYEQAVDDFAMVIQINPIYANVYQYRSQAYTALGRTAEAEADMQKYKELTGQ